jgi:hypothetical protein
VRLRPVLTCGLDATSPVEEGRVTMRAWWTPALALAAAIVLLMPATPYAAPVKREGGHYYELVSSQLTWASAQSAAEVQHAHLATIADASENAFVKALAGGSVVWIGASDDANDLDAQFLWVTGESFTYTNFATGEPDDDAGITGNGEVLVMLSDGTWDDTNPALDTFAQGFVVEWTNDTPDLDGDGLYGNEDPDDDNDLVNDGVDNCAEQSNAGQENADGDALGDACDPDDDGDGLADGSDNCPLLANVSQINTDGDVFGDACDSDDDGDGVSDGDDTCPTTAGATANGCPAAATPTPTPTPSATPTPVATTSPDVTAPTLKLSGKRTVPARRTVSVTVLAAAEARRLRATAKLRLGPKSVKLKPPAARDVAAGGSPILRFVLPARMLAKVKAALKLRKRVSVRITVTAADTAGNVATAVWAVRLR